MADSTLIAKRLGTLEHVLTASPVYLEQRGRPKVPADLAQHHCLLLGDASQWDFAPRRGGSRERIAVSVSGRFRSNSAALLHKAALEGHGILRCSSDWVRKDLALGNLVPVLPAYTVKDEACIFAVYPGTKHVSPRLRALLDFLAEWFRERKRHRGAVAAMPVAAE